MKRFIVPSLVLSGLFAASLTAKADSFRFEFTGTDAGGTQDISFVLPSPTTGDSCSTTTYLCFASVAVDFTGNVGYVPINFYTTAGGGAFDPFRGTGTPQLYIGLPSDGGTTDVVFTAGVYNLTEAGTGDPFVLTVSEVPEPSSIALLGTGILSALGLARKKFRIS